MGGVSLAASHNATSFETASSEGQQFAWSHHAGMGDYAGRQLAGRWSPKGSTAWSLETGIQPEYFRQQPWAAPITHEWCDELAQPRIFVILTAAVKAFINLARRGLRDQQRNATERLEMYQNVVRRWAVASDVDVIFAENSGADLSTIEAVVPPWRRHNFEFVSVPYTPERLPPRGRPDVGRIEAGSIVYALNTSKLLAARCPHDIVFGVTSRYFVHDFEQLVRGKCLKGRRRNGGKGGNAGQPPHSSGLPLPRVLVQNPVWRDKSTERHSYERETSILGFAASYAFEVFSWCVAPVPEKFEEYAHYSIGSEVHLGKLIKRMQDAGIADDYVCDLPSLPIMPVKEGSTGKWRESV